MDQPKRRKVLVTGANGRLGVPLAQRYHEKYDLRLMVQAGGDADRLTGCGEVVRGDLTDLACLKSHCQDVDTVIHFAAATHPASTWSELLPSNIVGTYNLLVAAKSQGCRRVILPSSIHAVSGYPREVQVKTTDPVNPGDLYGVTKCFAEALGRYMAEQEGLSVITIRIAACFDVEGARKPWSLVNMDSFLSHDDLLRLVELCIENERIHYALVHGVSDNPFKRLDMSDTRTLLGFHPEHDLAEENPLLNPLSLNRKVQSHSEIRDGGLSGIREELSCGEEG